VNLLNVRYGPWAVIAGASAGLGESFARLLAARGLNLVLLARRREALDRLAAELAAAHGIEVRVLAGDLARVDLRETIEALTKDLEVGLLVFNAAHSVIGEFVDRPLEEHLRVLDLNCRGPLVLAHLLGSAMARRGHGGIVLMTSLSGSQGGPFLASYAASKAFNLVLAEGIWEELGARGVEVIACRAGATRTPGYAASNPKASVSLMEPDAVAQQTLAALGRGPSFVPGGINKVAAFLFGRLLPRRVSIRFMGRMTRRLYG
jgi:short-subunit dehydrogenase